MVPRDKKKLDIKQFIEVIKSTINLISNDLSTCVAVLQDNCYHSLYNLGKNTPKLCPIDTGI